MNHQQILTKIDVTWSVFKASYAGLSDDQMIRPGVTESWSVKDIIGHVTVWEEEAIKHLPHILEGKRPPKYADLYGGIDAFNALKTEENRTRPLVEVLARLDEVHGQLVAAVRAAPDEQIATETRFRRRIRLDTYSHYPIHTRAILEWREAQDI